MIYEGEMTSQGFRGKYRIEGNGILALVIGSSIYYPRTFSGDLRNHLQLIFIDHRGFVPPVDNAAPETVTMDVLLNDIESIRKQLNLQRFVIIGHSGHAFLALEYAKAYHQHVSHVVLIGASPDYSELTTNARTAYFQQNAEPQRKAAFEEAMALLPTTIAADPDKRFVHFCTSAGPISWYDYTFDATPLWKGVYTNMPVIDRMWGVLFRDIDIWRGLDTFDKPVFLALGQFDYLTGTPFLWEGVQSRFKNLTLNVFEESAHTPQLEEPNLFNEKLMEWLTTPRG